MAAFLVSNVHVADLIDLGRDLASRVAGAAIRPLLRAFTS